MNVDYLSHCGSEARRWRRSLETTAGVQAQLTNAFRCLLGYDLEQARKDLSMVDNELQKLENEVLEFPSVVHLLRRQYWSETAFLRYLEGQLEAAGVCVDLAEKEMRMVLELDQFLLPLAFNFIDFLLQRARLARRANRHQDAMRFLEHLEDIFADRQPICTLCSGREIHVSDVREFFDTIVGLSQEERREAYQHLEGREPLSVRMARFEESIFHLPGFVIPYP